jgi:hypothetical protein
MGGDVAVADKRSFANKFIGQLPEDRPSPGVRVLNGFRKEINAQQSIIHIQVLRMSGSGAHGKNDSVKSGFHVLGFMMWELRFTTSTITW